MNAFERARVASDEVAQAMGDLAREGKLDVADVEEVAFYFGLDERQADGISPQVRVHFYADRDIAIRHVIAIQDRCPSCKENGITIAAYPKRGSMVSY